MSFSKNDLDIIKSKISIRGELEKKIKLLQKGRDYWCCCPFHDEKTPSCKINDDQNSFYCFGCGAKGDIFTLYTDLYHYNFIDAVKELSERAGVQINFQDVQKTKQETQVENILKLATDWFQKNLESLTGNKCNNYLHERKILKKTIQIFRLGYSYNENFTLYEYLKAKAFTDEDLLKSNVVKLDKSNKIRDYFYKRLIFPINNASGRVVGFGGRSLDETNPKYINSPESSIFQKRHLLYNLDTAKNTARKKNNLLICEGYLDVISLHQKGIYSVVAPLGTALTEDQLQLSWKFCSKPTIMFDGDKAGIRASYKSAIMALPLISAKKFLQFTSLPEGYDPDSYINKVSFKDFIENLKKTKTLVDFIFDHSSQSVELEKADEKILFDKYLDDLIETIKDKKTQFFYKSEFKSLFFDKIRKSRFSKKTNNTKLIKKDSKLNKKQNLSFIASAINHLSVREKILKELVNFDLFDDLESDFVHELAKTGVLELDKDRIISKYSDSNYNELLLSCMNTQIYQLFPYAKSSFDPQESYNDVQKSLQNLNTRLSNLQKINKSLDTFVNNSNLLNWSELLKINIEISDKD